MTFKVKTKGQNEGEKLLVPKLRFKEFKDEWKTYNLKQVLEIKNGLNKEKESFGTGTPIINYMDVNKHTILTSDKIKGLVKLSKKEIDNFKVNKGDIFFTRTSETSAEIGLSSSLIEDIENCVFSGFILKATPQKNIFNNLFSGYYFRTYKLRKEIIKHSSITTRALTSGSLLYGMNIKIPNIDEQEKIGKTLYLLDKKIELQQRRIEALKIYKKGLINKLLNSNESLNCKNIKLNNILIPGSKERVVDTSKFQKINIKLNLNGLSKNNSSREMADTRPFYIRNLNEIIIGKQNYFNGSIAIVTKEFDGCICSNAIMSFSVKNDNPKYIYYYISQPNYIRKRSFLANGTGQKELSEKEFLNFEINLPSIEKQNYIVTILDFVESKISIENLKYELLELFKKSLLQQMFI